MPRAKTQPTPEPETRDPEIDAIADPEARTIAIREALRRLEGAVDLVAEASLDIDRQLELLGRIGTLADIKRRASAVADIAKISTAVDTFRRRIADLTGDADDQLAKAAK